jgi:tetratricopeptide (TPR) repeat protein
MAPNFILQMKAARCIGRKDYARAISYYEKVKESEGPNPYTLCMMAQCSEWAGDSESAIRIAKEALAIDSMHFESHKLLAEIYLARKDYEKTKRHVQNALHNYPEPLPGPPRLLFWLLRLLSIIPAVRRVEKAATDEIKDPNKDTRKWFEWANEYLKWHEEQFGDTAEPTVH